MQISGKVIKLHHERCASTNVKMIYKITCPEDIVYIGQTRNLYKRLVAHKIASFANAVYTSIANHGWDAHICEVLHEFPNDIQQSVMDNYECLYMDLYRDAGIKLYNVRGGGINGVVAAETSIKLSKTNKGRKLSEDTKLKLSIAHKGKKKSAEHIQKIKETRARLGIGVGRKNSEETKLKMSLSQIGKKRAKHSAESNLAKSLRQKGVKQDKKGYSPSEETRKKVSEKIKLFYQNKKNTECRLQEKL